MSQFLNPQALITERVLVEIAQRSLQERLPNGWTVDLVSSSADSKMDLDAILVLSAPNGQLSRIAVETRRIVEPRDVSRLRDRLNPEHRSNAWEIGLVVARYLSESARARLVEAGLSFVDATGNIYIRSDTLPLFVADQGLNSDPWRGPGRPRGTLKGAPAAQVVRALLDTPGPWKIRELTASAQTSTGSVYRVIKFLEEEDLVSRNDDALVSVTDWVSLLRRWSADYEFLTTNAISRWVAPRGIERVIQDAVRTDPTTYAITGSIAAATWAPYAPARSIMAYTTHVSQIADQWGLRATDSGANVLIAEPAYPALTRGSKQRADGLSVAAPTQVAADLLTGPGRSPSEAEELIDWLVTHEHEWR